MGTTFIHEYSQKYKHNAIFFTIFKEVNPLKGEPLSELNSPMRRTQEK